MSSASAAQATLAAPPAHRRAGPGSDDRPRRATPRPAPTAPLRGCRCWRAAANLRLRLAIVTQNVGAQQGGAFGSAVGAWPIDARSRALPPPVPLRLLPVPGRCKTAMMRPCPRLPHAGSSSPRSGIGAWRSLVAHLHGVQGVPSSNLGAPTSLSEDPQQGLYPRLYPLLKNAP
jgi:hypothetical protein